jgi:hypothetical protein
VRAFLLPWPKIEPLHRGQRVPRLRVAALLRSLRAAIDEHEARLTALEAPPLIFARAEVTAARRRVVCQQREAGLSIRTISHILGISEHTTVGDLGTLAERDTSATLERRLEIAATASPSFHRPRSNGRARRYLTLRIRPEPPCHNPSAGRASGAGSSALDVARVRRAAHP